MKIMKTNNMLWAALSMTAALVMTACSSDSDLTETPAAPQAKKTIPYTVTVSDDAAITRATVSDDPTNRQLYFATGDQLYITGTDIQGVLDLQAGDAGKTTGATFSGELTYSGSGSPADDLSLTATLVSAQQTVGTQVSVDAAGAVTVNYPTAAYCATISDAVQQYSNLTGTSTYGARAFTLTQQTAFLNFVITFEDATTTGTELSAVVSNNSAAVCTANVTTVTDNGVKAKFVLPVAKGTTLSSANVKFGDKAAISFGASQTLEGKVYNVTKTQQYTMAANATAGDVGKVICSNGHIHSNVSDVICGGSASAMIAYVGNQNNANGNGAYSSTYNHGLAIALADVINTSGDPQTSASASYTNRMEWEDAKTACNSFKGSKPSGVTWMLPSAYQWKRMLIGCGGTTTYTTSLWDEMPFSYGNFRTQLTNCGTNVQGVYDVQAYTNGYWSSTEYSGGTTIYAWEYRFSNSDFVWSYKTSGCYVRAAFAF